MMKKKRFGLERRKTINGYFFVLPWAIGFLVFFASNLVQTIRYSFSKVTFNTDGTGYSMIYTGIENFRYALLEHGTFNRTLSESLGNILIDVPLIIFFSLFMAILINRKFPGRYLVRAILFLPVIMASGAIVSAMDSSLKDIVGGMSSVAVPSDNTSVVGLNAQYLMNYLVEFGLSEFIVGYIANAIGRVYEIVRNSGVQILIFLASLQSIAPALYEVAQIEGATAYETFWKITFPMVSPLILTNVVYTIVDLYSQAEIVTLASSTAFRQMNFGLSSAISIMSSTAICLILVVGCWLISRKVFYQN